MQSTEFDRQMMQRCVHLAKQAWGKTAPNPLVGAVIVKDGEVVGEGFHPGAGQPHAEVFALRAAGDRARGATIYVSLEPCNHYGRTPPCAAALVAAGIGKVVVGMIDPNPLVSGGGIATLQQAGIEVVVGVETATCEELNEGFVQRIVHRRPLGILKYAMTLDGKIATDSGHSTWVSSEPSRHYVHHLRAGCDAIVIGGNTLRRDNPYLTSHDPDAPNPLRVVMTRSLDVPLDAILWDISVAPTLVVTKIGVNPETLARLRDRGVQVLELDALKPVQVMQHLYDRGCLSVLWECGGTLAASAIADGAIQKVLAFIAPKIVGGSSAPSPVGNLNIRSMSDAMVLERVSWQQIGTDILIQGYLDKSEQKLDF
ncbi:bifunctional diaminohydroxyphosphoribosylaminopyrimidine deaminase/5-amino-6-(5-phosphoribosylamino)uracil reductase RibD [Chamaesiphon minutus]|uniref:Riboflavin biosynthesis protein RibD n=1 Tax=Chamaesiphon minutus (strain ATCC 27169 / PCC 6605) TaxID=1173020 RepID=K9UJ98_CHAP6|nr:bifunctional diaminohydroxyphosphoribosylaminopyrimidine deaminase/5-amino-6-(5-phosphoribosylamino)uracil reductase RibD [Chamaesiphon minutus]AFY94733.1 riboflavin biosynthesis protein RibD [Chamaesiphon minutus PCC 6605]